MNNLPVVYDAYHPVERKRIKHGKAFAWLIMANAVFWVAVVGIIWPFVYWVFG